jgi:hypothetical protein
MNVFRISPGRHFISTVFSSTIVLLFNPFACAAQNKWIKNNRGSKAKLQKNKRLIGWGQIQPFSQPIGGKTER